MKCFILFAVMLVTASTIVSGQVKVTGNNNKNNTIVTGNNNRINNSNVTKKITFNKVTYNIYMYNPLSNVEKQQLDASLGHPGKSPGDGISVLLIPRIGLDMNIYAELNKSEVRLILSKVSAAFEDNQFQVIPFPEASSIASLKLPRRPTTDIPQAIYLSGADICVEVDMITNSEEGENSITLILSAYNRVDGSQITRLEETSNSFRTTQYGLIMENVIPGAVGQLIEKIKTKIK